MPLGFMVRVYPNLPNLIINPNIDFIGTLQNSRLWRIYYKGSYKGYN